MLQFGRYSPAREHIRKAKFPAGLENAMDLGKYRRFVRREIDDAIGDDDVYAGVRDASARKILYLSGDKRHVGPVISETVHMPCLMPLGDGKLLWGHVDADDVTGGADNLTQEIGVPA